MTATASAPTTALRVQARPAGFLVDVASVARRAIRQIPREPEAVIPALIVPIFFYVLNIGALSKITHAAARIQLQGLRTPRGRRLRRHGRVPGVRARHRHPERLLRPAHDHAGPPAPAAARAS